jgi:hypothetical protein
MAGPEAQAHPSPNVFLFFYFFEAVSSSAGTDWARSSGLARYWPMPVTGPFLFVRRVWTVHARLPQQLCNENAKRGKRKLTWFAETLNKNLQVLGEASLFRFLSALCPFFFLFFLFSFSHVLSLSRPLCVFSGFRSSSLCFCFLFAFSFSLFFSGFSSSVSASFLSFFSLWS